MSENKIFKNAPLIAFIHNISKNQMKYLNSKLSQYDFGKEIRYIMMIYDNPNCSQDELVNLYGESKANIAKDIKKLENQQLIEKIVNPKNRRKYMLKTTAKGDELVPKIKEISLNWEKEVGISNDHELYEKLNEIAIKGMKLI